VNRDIELNLDTPPALAPDDPARLSPMNTREQAMLASYDFLKHVSGLSLIAMGGMLGLAQGLSAKPSPAILMSVGMVGLSGFMSLVFMAGIAATQIRQVVHKSSNAAALIIVMLVLMLFAAGLGMFIGTFFHEVRHT
jgi:ABC-type polysaccharide/polyol phosphate export permease